MATTPERKMQALKAVLADMLDKDEDISARAIARRIPDIFRNASAITRDCLERRKLFEEAVASQKRIRKLAGNYKNRSRSEMTLENGKIQERLARAEADRDLLSISHRIMFRALGEAGGTKAWVNFFKEYRQAYETLKKLKACDKEKVVTPFEKK